MNHGNQDFGILVGGSKAGHLARRCATGLTAFEVIRQARGQATSALPATVDRLLRVTVLYLQYEHLLVTANQDVETQPLETQS